MAIDLSLPPDEVLVRHINKVYNRHFTLNDVYFDRDTLADVNYRGCDTTVVMRARRSANWSGASRIYYNRINLTKFLAGQSVLVSDSINMTSEARPVVLREVGIRLDAVDVVSDVVPPDVLDDLLRISKQSLIYRGSIHLKYLASLKDRLGNTLLNGFYAPIAEETT